MSKQIVCDYCEKVLDTEEEHLWIKVGWRIAHPDIEDACSFECARQLITGLKKAQREIDREIARENADVGGS